MDSRIEAEVQEVQVAQVRIERIPYDCFKVQRVAEYDGPFDPAGLCDNTAYDHQCQIRLEKDGSVYLSYRHFEDSDLHTITVPYAKFFAAFKEMVNKLKGAQ